MEIKDVLLELFQLFRDIKQIIGGDIVVAEKLARIDALLDVIEHEYWM